MGRIRHSIELMKKSWGVIREDKALLLFPIVSGVCLVAVVAIFAVPAIGAIAGARSTGTNMRLWIYPVLFAMYFVLAFVQFFFNAALIGAANMKFEGGNPSFGDGIRIASGRLGKIACWAVIAATVGLIIRSLEERAGILGRIVLGLIGVAWALMTYFVVPVLVFENIGPFSAIKRSGHLFKQTWGETISGRVGIGLAGFLLSIPGIAVAIFGGFLLATGQAAIGAIVVAAGVLWVVVVSVFVSGMQQVYNCALYRYATRGVGSAAFSAEELAAGFRAK